MGAVAENATAPVLFEHFGTEIPLAGVGQKDNNGLAGVFCSSLLHSYRDVLVVMDNNRVFAIKAVYGDKAMSFGTRSYSRKATESALLIERLLVGRLLIRGLPFVFLVYKPFV